MSKYKIYISYEIRLKLVFYNCTVEKIKLKEYFYR